MNYSFLNGRVATVPKVSIVPLEAGVMLYVCKFVTAVPDGIVNEKQEMRYNFFECIAFEDTAKKISKYFLKSAKIVVFGKLVNHIFKDINNTSHFTNIILVEHVEFGDTESGINRINLEPKLPDFKVIANIDEVDKLYEEVCKQGFLCVDEDDYYNIASSNMDVI